MFYKIESIIYNLQYLFYQMFKTTKHSKEEFVKYVTNLATIYFLNDDKKGI
jgi:hypothetical protein